MDLRKSAVTASAKSLRLLKNGFVNAGGEIEKRKGFPLWTTAGALAGTYGLGGIALSLYVFGSTARPAGLPSWIGYQQLVGANIQRISDVEVFNEGFYVVVQQPDGAFKHYYQGALVADAPNCSQVLPHRNKVYALNNPNAWNVVYFSMIDNPNVWTPGTGNTGAGYIQLDGGDEGSLYLMGMAAYYDQLALFSRSQVQMWAMDQDPAQNQLVQTLGASGLIAWQALARYSTGDVLFLHDSGMRSLKARDSSNAGIVTDIGSPIDIVLRKVIRDARNADPNNIVPAGLQASKGVIEPSTGQVWLSIGNEIYVLSQAPSSHVSAWSIYDLGFPIDAMITLNENVWIRSGDNLYVYGGGISDTYDTSQVEVITPMIAGSEPATNKTFFGLDGALEGTWVIEVGTDPANPDTREQVATVTGPTFSLQNLGLQNDGTHISARLTCSDSARARVGNLVFHYNKGSTD